MKVVLILFYNDPLTNTLRAPINRTLIIKRSATSTTCIQQMIGIKLLLVLI